MFIISSLGNGYSIKSTWKEMWCIENKCSRHAIPRVNPNSGGFVITIKNLDEKQ